MNCPKCGRPSLESSRGRLDNWCRYVVDCGYSTRVPPKITGHRMVFDRATIEYGSRVLPVKRHVTQDA
jgi:hypothetical protein